MSSTSNHAVVLPDGTSAIYHLRSLRASSSIANSSNIHEAKLQDDIANWTKFCSSAFSYKPDPPPPSYFARHLHNDPRGDASLVRVLVVYQCRNDDAGGDDVDDTFDEIASSVRIFRRTLSIPGRNNYHGEIPTHYMEAGGIGEVCTAIEHRRRGLSSILLKDAIQIMNSLSSSSEESGQQMACSLLHASPDFRPVYSKVGGYKSVRSEWSVVPVRWKSLEEDGRDCTSIVRHAKFPNDARQLQTLHMEYSEKRLITIVRSEEYWNKYVSAELGDTLWILSMKQPKSTAADAQRADVTIISDMSDNAAETPGENEDIIVAWLSLRKRVDRFQLREFGVDKKCTISNITTTLGMKFLLRVALDQAGVSSFADKGDCVSLLLPSFVLSEMRDEMTRMNDADNRLGTLVSSFLDFDNVTEENDDGWMYIHWGHSQPSVVELTTRDTDPIQHLIWPTDSF